MPLSKWIDIPPVWLALFAAVAWFAAKVTPVADLLALRLIGYAFVTAGLLFMLLAVIEMRRHRTTPIPHQQPSALVTSGVFRVSRNPIYLGDALVLCGLVLLWQAWLALPLLPLFVWVITERFIRAEEERLKSGFGQDFAAWAASTRRWV